MRMKFFISKLILVLRTDKIDIVQLCDMSFIGLVFGKLKTGSTLRHTGNVFYGYQTSRYAGSADSYSLHTKSIAVFDNKFDITF